MAKESTGPHDGRPRGHRISVWVLPEEKEKISRQAFQAGMSESSFLRACGLNQPIRSVLDLRAVAELAKINGDLGRIAGLLKLWLKEKRGQGAPPINVEMLMEEMRSLQGETLRIMGRVVRDR